MSLSPYQIEKYTQALNSVYISSTMRQVLLAALNDQNSSEEYFLSQVNSRVGNIFANAATLAGIGVDDQIHANFGSGAIYTGTPNSIGTKFATLQKSVTESAENIKNYAVKAEASIMGVVELNTEIVKQHSELKQLSEDMIINITQMDIIIKEQSKTISHLVQIIARQNEEIKTFNNDHIVLNNFINLICSNREIDCSSLTGKVDDFVQQNEL